MNEQQLSAAEMIARNNQWREQLTTENREYYEKLLLYLRTTGLFYDDREIEGLLLEILQDILDAQNDGQRAADFFGKNPQQAADALIGRLGKASWKERLKWMGLLFGISSFFSVLGALINPQQGINLLVLVLNGVLSFLGIELIVLSLHRSIYTKIIRGKWLTFLSIWLFVMTVFGLFILIAWLTPPLITIPLPGVWGTSLLLLAVIGTAVWWLRGGVTNLLRLGISLNVLLFASLGIAARLPQTAAWMASDSGKIVSVVLVLAFWALDMLLTLIEARKPG
ncbi:MAG: DUF1129 domain-containing protein [Sporolactobacillus sp.]|jgi:uncharacterized membrane-anchored protein|nr:DUF1129 domain-containing protein [Sporolactobacillus sp.]MCI1881979.1 DUF1129 domain-containing protein [Sporolactobacillus sp.]